MLPPTMLRLIAFSCALLVVSASDVLEFTDSDFATKIADHDVALVEFYAPWCGHCKRLAPEYEKAATKLKRSDPPVTLVKVDCTAEKEVCSKYGVSGYPTLKIFKNGEFSKEYNGQREADDIVRVMQKEAGPSSKEVSTVKELEEFLAKEGAAVVGFFKDASAEMAKMFKKVADTYEGVRFGYTSDKDVMGKYGYTDQIVLFRPKVMENKFESSAVVMEGDPTSAKLRNFLDDESFGLCGVRGRSNAEKFKKPTFIAFYKVDYIKDPKGTNYWRNRIMKVAKKIKDAGRKAFFAISDKDEMSNELGECGLEDVSSDGPVVCAYDEASRKFNYRGPFTMDTFEKFVNDVLDQELDPYLKSEDLPEDNSGPVKVVVAKNFQEIVNDPDRDVLIEFYAPWCGHCKQLAPKYDELGEKLEGESEITIAKMDATANDVPTPYEVRGFPTIYFAPKGSKSSPKKYEGGREVKDFINYLAREATNELKGYDRTGKKKGGKKKKTEL